MFQAQGLKPGGFKLMGRNWVRLVQPPTPFSGMALESSA
jgi:hypothetical protein